MFDAHSAVSSKRALDDTSWALSFWGGGQASHTHPHKCTVIFGACLVRPQFWARFWMRFWMKRVAVMVDYKGFPRQIARADS
ncbi:MAG: hypothetical protein EBU88_12170 [Acidobacteria bacterium]|nr:hypothetical protein [Acidobacteriota bacterium]